MKYAPIAVALAGAVLATAAPTQAEPFKGPYVGVTAGWDRGEASDRVSRASDNRDALLLGGYAGYDYRLGDRFVVGAEAGLSATTDDRISAVGAGRSLGIDPRYSFDLTARAGYLVADDVLLYARAGYTNTRVRSDHRPPASGAARTDSLDGWLVGGGVERAIADRISARVEYRYNDVGQADGRYERHQTLVGVGYRF